MKVGGPFGGLTREQFRGGPMIRDNKLQCDVCGKDARQHDDHIWLTVYGEAWAIERATPTVLYLWRGYEPNIQRRVLDIRNADFESYCEVASEWLRYAT